MADLRALLEMRQASPLSVLRRRRAPARRIQHPGNAAVVRVAVTRRRARQLTDFTDPVSGQLLPDGRILLERDEGGNERTQLYLLGEQLEPLVVDARFIHGTPHVARGGTLLAYATNRRNGSDFDIVARDLRSGEERTFELGGYCGVESVSPDGRWIVVERTGDRSADNDLFIIDLESGEVVHATPHDDAAEYYAPVWLADGSGFLLATNEGRDTFAIARHDLAAGTRTVVQESEWDLEPYGDDAGRSVLVVANEDGYSRLDLRDPQTLELRDRVPLPGNGVVEQPVFSKDGSLLAFSFSSAVEPHDVYLYDLDRDHCSDSRRARATSTRRRSSSRRSTVSRASTASRCRSTCSSRRATGRFRSSSWCTAARSHSGCRGSRRRSRR